MMHVPNDLRLADDIISKTSSKMLSQYEVEVSARSEKILRYRC